MGHEANKTEHSGPKRGSGAYWGRKVAAKHESNRKRRADGKAIVREKKDRRAPTWTPSLKAAPTAKRQVHVRQKKVYDEEMVDRLWTCHPDRYNCGS